MQALVLQTFMLFVSTVKRTSVSFMSASPALEVFTVPLSQNLLVISRLDSLLSLLLLYCFDLLLSFLIYNYMVMAKVVNCFY